MKSTEISSQLLSERMQRIDTSQIRRMFDLAGTLKNPINLSIGQPHYTTPEPVIEALNKALSDGFTSYTQTQGILPLREKLAQKWQSDGMIKADPDNILISAGVSGLLVLLFLALIDRGDRVLLIDPTFLIYKSMLEFYNASIETIPESFGADDIAKINPDGLKMILFAMPSNPSGKILSKDQLQMLGNLADQSGATLVSDEIYEIFDYENKFVPAASVYPQTLTLKGFSKSYSMTGLRLAAATGPEHIIKAMTTIQQYTIVCAPTPVQHAGITALDVDMSEFVAQYAKNRIAILNALEKKVNCFSPDGAFYVFPEIDCDDMKFVEKAIREQELLIVPGSIFTETSYRIRISYAVEEESLNRGIKALLTLLDEIQSERS